MKVGLIYKRQFGRSQHLEVEVDSIDDAFVKTMDLDPQEHWVEHLIDFEAQTVTRVALTDKGTLIEIPDGEFGEATPTEYFEQMAQEEPSEEEA